MESGEASEKSGKEGRGEEQGKEGKQKYQEKWLTHFKTPCFVVTKVNFPFPMPKRDLLPFLFQQ